MKIKKMSFVDIQDTMSKEEMKCIMGGSGGLVTGGTSSYGGLTYGNSNYGGSTSYSLQTAAGQAAWSSSMSYSGTSSGGSSAPMVLTTGWVSTDKGIKTTDQVSISRYFDFLMLNGGTVTNSQMATFIMNEGTIVGQRENSLQLYGTILNNVPVMNNYKGPSTIAQGVVYNNGLLDINSSAYGGGTAAGGILAGSTYVTTANSSPTYAKLTNFGRNDIFYGFKNIDFSNIGRASVIPYNSITGQYDYNKTFQPVMKLNFEGAVSIAEYEKLSLTVYDRDSNQGQNTTIGFGHLLHRGAIQVGDLQSITFDQAISYLAKDILSAEKDLNQKIENMELTGKFSTSQYFALVDMAYNAGPGSENNKTITHQVLTAMKSGGYKAANDVCIKFYTNESGGEQERKYFEAQAFINGRTLTPEQASAELKTLGLKK